jgi:hypothetical protein
MLVVRGGVHAYEGANTSARNRNPEREKAGITLRSTEHQLALAETCANKASVAREKKREEASVAREHLRNAELLYVQVLSFWYPLFGLESKQTSTAISISVIVIKSTTRHDNNTDTSARNRDATPWSGWRMSTEKRG